MTSAARKAVLGAVREHLAEARRREGVIVHPLPPAAVAPTARDREEQVAEFARRLGAVGGVAWRVGDLPAAAACIDELIGELRATRVAIGDAPLTCRLRDHLRAPAELVGPNDRTAIERCEMGITTARAAIVETGSLLLDAALERYRLVSLLPRVHVAVVPVDALVEDLDATFALLGGAPSSAVTLVTGPSRTADIELTLVVGVHGPEALHVILVERA